jgi:hypothetical protein
MALLQWCVRRGGITGSLEVHQHIYTGAGSAALAVPVRTPCFDDVLPIACDWTCQALLVHVVVVLQWFLRRGGITGNLEVHQHLYTGAGSSLSPVIGRVQRCNPRDSSAAAVCASWRHHWRPGSPPTPLYWCWLSCSARTPCFDDVLPIACDWTCPTMQST